MRTQYPRTSPDLEREHILQEVRLVGTSRSGRRDHYQWQSPDQLPLSSERQPVPCRLNDSMSNHKGQRPGLVWEFGIARSDDGVTWTRDMEPPFFSTKNLFGYLTSSTFTEFNGEWLVLVDGAGSIQSPSNGIFRLARPAP